MENKIDKSRAKTRGRRKLKRRAEFTGSRQEVYPKLW
jgi:hypothetical protein